jgi:hypothetical protein
MHEHDDVCSTEKVIPSAATAPASALTPVSATAVKHACSCKKSTNGRASNARHADSRLVRPLKAR